MQNFRDYSENIYSFLSAAKRDKNAFLQGEKRSHPIELDIGSVRQCQDK